MNRIAAYIATMMVPWNENADEYRHTLDDRVYTCPICGNVIDRDHQATINTDTEGLRILRLSYAETA